MTALCYKGNDKEIEGVLRISPSKFSMFMERPHQWYREVVLKEEEFKGNTSSIIGTIVHYCADCVSKGVHPDKKEIEAYIDLQEGKEDIDTKTVREAYPAMVHTLINDYVLANIPEESELDLETMFTPRVNISGQLDGYDNGMVTDYKTYNSKTKPRAIPMHYKYQLLVYSYLCIKNNRPVDRIRLVYINRNIDGGVSEKTGKPLKSYPPEVTVLTESVTKEDLEFIESCLTLCAETYETAQDNPELVHLLYRDMRLKGE